MRIGLYVMNSARMQPTDHISIAMSYELSPSSNSVDRYHNVTISLVNSFKG